MRKRVILAFMLIFALVAASSCSLIIKDEEVDKQTPIIEVVGKTFTKAEVNEQVEAVMDYEEYMYSMYGISYDRTDASTISMAQDSAIDAMVQQAVLEKKAADLGLDVLSDEEKAEVEESVDSTYTLYSDSVKSAYFADTELEGEELDAAVEAKMAELAYPTREELVESETNAKVLEKVRDEAVKDVTVSEEELQEAYNTHVESAMTTYGNSPSSYGTDVQNGATIYYVPAGYRYVKHILIEFTDEDSQAISDLESQISQKQTELSTAETSLADLGEDASADDEATAQNRATLSETVEARTAEIADLESQLEDAKEAAYAAIQPTVDEVARQAGLSRREVNAALESVVEPISLEEPLYTDGGDAMYVIDQVRDPDSEDSWISGLEFRQTVAGLTPREKRIMELRYLKGETQMEVAREIGISQAQVSRLEKSALEQFRHK